MKDLFVKVLGSFLIASLLVGCDIFYDFFEHLPPEHPDERGWDNDYEEEQRYLWSTDIDFDYITEIGFNLRFKEIRVHSEDIIDDTGVVETISGVMLNIADVLLVSSDDVITVANRNIHPRAPDEYPYIVGGYIYQPLLVNCGRIPMNMSVNYSTVYLNDAANYRYRGTLTFISDFWQNGEYNGDEYDQSRPGFWFANQLALFEFEMYEGILILKAPAQYSIGVLPDNSGVSLPLTGTEVTDIITNGVDGVDYTLFVSGGFVYVRIKNNLYQRRYNSWVYVGLADTPVTNT